MIIRRVVIFLVLWLLVFSVPAQAAHCPSDVNTLLQAFETNRLLEKRNVSRAELAMLEKSVKKAVGLHESGIHQESLKILHELMDRLKIIH